MSYRTWRVGFTAVLLVANFWPAIANAQTVSAADQRSKAYKNLAGACEADMARFCPNVHRSAVAHREQFMCLKVYRADLALDCRKAVNTISTISQAGVDHGN